MPPNVKIMTRDARKYACLDKRDASIIRTVNCCQYNTCTCTCELGTNICGLGCTSMFLIVPGHATIDIQMAKVAHIYMHMYT